MQPNSGGANRQFDLLPRSKRSTIPIADNHKLVRLTDTLDWTEMEDRAQQIRCRKLKNAAGRPPHLRASLGAMLLMATRKLTYREAEDLIRYYGPARYLCGLTETEWTPDFTTIQDFTELMGEEGITTHQSAGGADGGETKIGAPQDCSRRGEIASCSAARKRRSPIPTRWGLWLAS